MATGDTRAWAGAAARVVSRGAAGSADAAVNLTTRQFVNALGDITRSIDPNGRERTLEYNTLGELVREIDPMVTLRYE